MVSKVIIIIMVLLFFPVLLFYIGTPWFIVCVCVVGLLWCLYIFDALQLWKEIITPQANLLVDYAS